MALKILKLPFSDVLIRKIHSWLKAQPMAIIINGNNYTYPQQPFPLLMAGGSKRVPNDNNWQDAFLKKDPASWCFGCLGYDLKGRAKEDNREPFIGFPEQGVFEAEAVFERKGDFIQLHSANPESLYSEVQNLPEYQPLDLPEFPPFRPAVSKQAYLSQVEKVRQLIREGDVYELNLCQYFESNTAPDGLDFYLQLNRQFPMPFSGWFKCGQLEIASASPERFLRKTGNELISQPIKGTAARGHTPEQDLENREKLFHSEKERAENMMIVDLVRNDLAKVSRIGSTTVEEMFGIYAFPTVFQMISTVRSVKATDKNLADVLDSTFPMGSMTGAPKYEVMKQIRSLEPFSRGAYSGALGFFGPDGDFDFNVLIRSLFINHEKKQCGFAVGSAITIDSEAEEEWAECMAKAAALLKVCGNPGISA